MAGWDGARGHLDSAGWACDGTARARVLLQGPWFGELGGAGLASLCGSYPARSSSLPARTKQRAVVRHGKATCSNAQRLQAPSAEGFRDTTQLWKGAAQRISSVCSLVRALRRTVLRPLYQLKPYLR